jgi:hypothetical protein
MTAYRVPHGRPHSDAACWHPRVALRRMGAVDAVLKDPTCADGCRDCWRRQARVARAARLARDRATIAAAREEVRRLGPEAVSVRVSEMARRGL